MRGSISKTCPCPAQYDSRGRRKACKKAHGSWSFVIDVGIDQLTKKRKQLRQRGYATQADAESAMDDALSKLRTGLHRDDQGRTVGQWLDEWISQKTDSLRPTTLTEYRRHIDAHIKPRLGERRLRDLRTSDIRALLRGLQEPAGGQRPIGTTTVRRVHATLRSALGDAVREDLISTNPATNARPPRKPRPKVNPWSPEELGTFLDALAGHPYAAYFETVAMTGLRRGEAAGLRWSDVDLDRGVITVRQQITHVDGDCPICGQHHKGITFGPPKTSSGEARRVDLGSHVVGVLLAHRLAQDAQKELLGTAYGDHDLVFAREDGQPVNPTYFTSAFQQLCKKAGVRQVRLHDLRHGRASLLMAAGIEIGVVSKMLGHSSIAITADTYSHMMEGLGRKSADAADALVPRRTTDRRDQSVTNSATNGERPVPAEAATSP